MTKYKWNKRKFLKNMFYSIIFIIEMFMFEILFLAAIGIDIKF